MEQKAIRMGAAVLALALLLRLGSAWEQAGRQISRTLILFSTGRLVTETVPPQEEVSAEPVRETTPEEPAVVPAFGEQEESLVQVNAQWQVDTLSLLQQPLDWQLKGENPTVLILHTHATESYEPDGTYQESSPYRTMDEAHNMLSVGDRVAELLEEGGIRVIHDRTFHDYPSYNNAYGNARQTIADYLAQYPSLCLVLDLHRDAAEDGNGKQKVSTATVEGKTAAQLMLVMGSDKGSLSYPDWERNLALAVKLQARLQQKYPGLCKPIKLGTYRYNQDLSTGALLVEVGTAGNTHAQALTAAEFLAQGILDLANGANLSS